MSNRAITFAALGVAAAGILATTAVALFRRPIVEVHIPMAEMIDAVAEVMYGMDDEGEGEDDLPYDAYIGPVTLTETDYKILDELDFDSGG